MVQWKELCFQSLRMWIVFGFLKFPSWGNLGKSLNASEPCFLFWEIKTGILTSRPAGRPVSWLKNLEYTRCLLCVSSFERHPSMSACYVLGPVLGQPLILLSGSLQSSGDDDTGKKKIKWDLEWKCLARCACIYWGLSKWCYDLLMCVYSRMSFNVKSVWESVAWLWVTNGCSLVLWWCWVGADFRMSSLRMRVSSFVLLTDRSGVGERTGYWTKYGASQEQGLDDKGFEGDWEKVLVGMRELAPCALGLCLWRVFSLDLPPIRMGFQRQSLWVFHRMGTRVLGEAIEFPVTHDHPLITKRKLMQ